MMIYCKTHYQLILRFYMRHYSESQSESICWRPILGIAISEGVLFASEHWGHTARLLLEPVCVLLAVSRRTGCQLSWVLCTSSRHLCRWEHQCESTESRADSARVLWESTQCDSTAREHSVTALTAIASTARTHCNLTHCILTYCNLTHCTLTVTTLTHCNLIHCALTCMLHSYYRHPPTAAPLTAPPSLCSHLMRSQEGRGEPRARYQRDSHSPVRSHSTQLRQNQSHRINQTKRRQER